MEIVFKTPDPHSTKQRLIMEAFRVGDLREMWVACGTKFGKSLAAASAIASASVVKPGSLWRWVAPIYSQSKIGMKYCKQLMPGRPFVRHNEADMSSTWVRQNASIQYCHGTDPETLEGEAVHGYVLDECSKMKEQVYLSSKTTTTVTRGPHLCISTPRGKNWFYNRCMDARDEMRAALKQGRNPRMVFLTARTIDNPFVQKSAIDEAMRNMPDRLFRQYYLAEFMDDSAVFVGFNDCVVGEPIPMEGRIQRWISDNASEQTVVMGVDWAKTTDFTVFTAWSYGSGKPRMVGAMRFQGMDYLSAVKQLVMFAREFGDVSLIYHDKTGVGQAIDDLLSSTPLAFEGITFTQNSKSHMVNNMIVGIQKNSLILPDWYEMRRELDQYEVVTNQLGNMRYSAPSGQHDDIVSAMMLGYAAACELTGGSIDVKFAEQISNKDITVDSWYTELMDESEDDLYTIKP